jgi:glycosyltransferase involved in cell wall biosynthesis
MPAISVIMPVYNTQQYVYESIASVLAQNFGDFEFLIFNDGSTDKSSEIIRSFKDPRILFTDFDYNQGYVALLNAGIKKATGKYIARMDADDISHPNRFQSQYNFLEQHPQYIVCGTLFSIIGGRDRVELPLDDEEIKLKMLYITPFCHPSVMMRTATLRDKEIYYDADYMPAEDHELWGRLASYGKLANLPDTLLNYRVHDNNISLKKRSPKQNQTLYQSRLNYITWFFKNTALATADFTLLHTLFFKETDFSYHELLMCGELIERIIDKRATYPAPAGKVYSLLAEKFFYRCTTSTSIGLKSFLLANKFDFVNSSRVAQLKLLLKALIKYKK